MMVRPCLVNSFNIFNIDTADVLSNPDVGSSNQITSHAHHIIHIITYFIQYIIYHILCIAFTQKLHLHIPKNSTLGLTIISFAMDTRFCSPPEHD